jgi:PAT family acetyl-CoA transporter-like MFS transporter 1
VPFAAVDTLLPLELQRNGFKKSQLALLSTALLPISMTAQAVVSGFFRSGATPLRVFVFAIGARLVQGFLAVGLVAWLRAATRGGAPPPLAVYAAGLLVLSLGALVHAAMFVAQMAFFNRVSDPRIGGTYLTMLNTLANLGSQWPATVVLAVAGSIERSPGAPNAFYVVASCSLLIGAVWLGLMAPRILALQRQPLSVWRAADDDGQDALKTK